MPYKNIVFVKLEKRLLNDPRFYCMSETSQLLLVKLFLTAAETYNKIPKDIGVLKRAFRTNLYEKSILKSLEEIKRNFPKFKENNDIYYFEGFEEKTNWIPERSGLGYSPGNPKETLGDSKGIVEKEKEKEKEKELKQPSAVLQTALEKIFKDNFNIYQLINKVKKQLGWPKEQQFPEEVLLGVCDAYWREKEKAQIQSPFPWFMAVLRKESESYFASKNIEEHRKLKEQGALSLKDIMSKIGR